MLFRRLFDACLCIAFAAALLLAMEGTARAYVDPGSGLMLFQSVGAVVTGVLFFFRQRLRRLFARENDKSTGETR